jgi:hypothetical protein
MEVDAHQRLRPKAIVGVKLLDLLLDVRSADQRERADKSLVIVHQRLIEIENVHSRDPLATNINRERGQNRSLYRGRRSVSAAGEEGQRPTLGMDLQTASNVFSGRSD